MSEINILYAARYFGHLNEQEHEHDFFQIFLPTSNRVCLQSNGESCPCDAETSFYFVAPGHMHTLLLSANEAHADHEELLHQPRIYHCALDCKFTVSDPLLAQRLSQLPMVVPRPPLCGEFAEWIIRAAAHRSPMAQVQMEALLYAMLLFLLDTPGEMPDTELLFVPDTTVQVGNVNISMLTEYIDRHYAEKITLDKLMQLACINKTTLCHAFRSVVGMSPIAYVNFRRMEIARRLLLETHMNISEIAVRVGYHNVNHFCRNFKEKEGLAPSAYRIHNLRTLNNCRDEILHRDIYDRELGEDAILSDGLQYLE